MGAIRRVVLPLVGMLLAAGTVAVLWGFTVDDALIGARYAFHVATGAGARFNRFGPATDGVTPLVWPWLLAPFARTGPLAGLWAAKWIGALSWIAVVGLFTREVDLIAKERRSWAHLSLLVVLGTPAIAAWAVAGMETGVALSLATLAALCRRPLLATALAGATALFRPEMVLWALVLGAGHAWERRRFFLPCALAVGPFVVVCAVRMMVFGAVAPLALRAKPSDLTHGLVYVAASFLVVGPMLAVFAPWAWKKLPVRSRWLLAAFGVHVLVVIAVGGDWMPMSRLLVPVLPSLGIVFAELSKETGAVSNIVRLVLCVCGQVFVAARVGYDATQVSESRLRLISALAPKLQSQDVVAALDIGWVGAAFDGTVVDLAGLTDPSVASLAGGHTSKAISPMLFAEKRVSKMVLLIPPEGGWEQGKFARAVESRIARMEWVRERYAPEEAIEGNAKLRYLVVARRQSVGMQGE